MNTKRLIAALWLCLSLLVAPTAAEAHRQNAAQSSSMRFRVQSTKANAVAIARQLFAANGPGAKHLVTEVKVWPNVTATYVQNSDDIAVTFQTLRGRTVRWVKDPTGRYLGTDVYLGRAAELGAGPSRTYR